MSETTPLMRTKEIVIQELNDEILIYDLRTNKALSLNKTSAAIWQLSTGEKSISEIANEASKKLNCRVDNDFVWLALWRLKKENLIETEISAKFGTATRREIIKKVGLTSMAALPVITSLIAPMSLQAQSGGCGGASLGLGCECSVPEACASNCCGVTTAVSLPRFCVPFGGDSNGAFCRSQCECSSTCCGFGAGGSPICVACGSVAPGARCRISRECASGSCSLLNPGVCD